MAKGLSDAKNFIIIYLVSFAFLVSTPYLIEYPVGDEFAYVKQTKLLSEGKTQPNWLQSTSYLTMLVGMPFIQNQSSVINLRLIMMLIAAISAPLMYLILRELNANKTIAALASFVLITNPSIALYLRQFITEPISLPLHVLAILLLVKGIKTGEGKFFITASVVSILGFLNKQIDAIPALAAFLFLLLHGTRNLPLKPLEKFFLNSIGVRKKLVIKNLSRNLILAGISVAFTIGFFSYNFLTTGHILSPTTISSTVSPDAPYAPQFGIKPSHNAFRIIQDIIFLGFMFLPFGLSIKTGTNQKFISLISVGIAFLAVLSGKSFVFHSNQLLIFFAAAIFAYSGLNLASHIIQNRRSSAVMNFSFIALVGCTLFTIFKINIFLMKYYIVFLPFVLMFLVSKVKSVVPYILTIVILGGFGLLVTINDIQTYETIWAEVNKLLISGVAPNDIQGHPTVVGWLNDLVDNIYADYKIKMDKHKIFNDLVDLDSIRVVKIEN